MAGRRVYAEGHLTPGIKTANWRATYPEKAAAKRDRDRERKGAVPLAVYLEQCKHDAEVRADTRRFLFERLALWGCISKQERSSLQYFLGLAWKRITSWCPYAACCPNVVVAPDPAVSGTYLIYGLVDPRTKVIRYAGLSTKGVTRAQAHREPSEYEKNFYKSRWVESLKRLGMTYEIVILEILPDGDWEGLCAAEMRWIALLGRKDLNLGELTNLTHGGDGIKGLQFSKEECESRASRMKACWEDDEYRDRVLQHPNSAVGRASENLKKRWADPKQAAKMRDVSKRAAIISMARHGSPMKDPGTRDLVALRRRLVAQGIRGPARSKRVFRRRLWNALFGVAVA